MNAITQKLEAIETLFGELKSLVVSDDSQVKTRHLVRTDQTK